MIYPTIEELTKGKFNRYELAIATAKCARIITTDYIKQREFAEKAQAGSKDSDKPVVIPLDKECRDEKPLKNAINKIYDGTYVIVKCEENENGETEYRGV